MFPRRRLLDSDPSDCPTHLLDCSAAGLGCGEPFCSGVALVLAPPPGAFTQAAIV